MAEEFLVGKSCSLAVGEENDFVCVNVGQRVIGFQLSHGSVVLPTLILGPELGIQRSAVGGKGYAHFGHALHQAAAAHSLVVGMGHNDQSVFQQRSQSSHYQSRMADSKHGFAPSA